MDGIGPLVKAWLRLTFAFNGLNRSMDLGDLYPFVLNPVVVAKLGFTHDLIRGRVGGEVPMPSVVETVAPVPENVPPGPPPEVEI